MFENIWQRVLRKERKRTDYFQYMQEKNAEYSKTEHVDRFLGSLIEYSQFKGADYEIMDTGRPEKFVSLRNSSLLLELINQGCEGLIRFGITSQFGYTHHCLGGIPVRRKK